MAYREKLAWLELVGMAVAYGAYFVAVAMAGPLAPGREATVTFLGLFAAATVARLLILGLGWLVLRARSGAEARAKPDERDRAIARRGAEASYYVLLGLMMWVGVILPLTDSGWAIANAGLAAIIIGEMVRLGVAVASYRRGWHG